MANTGEPQRIIEVEPITAPAEPVHEPAPVKEPEPVG